jgi:esterase
VDLHFETYGRGEPLIILHGLLGSLENWRSISARLAAHFKVIAVDQRNHGRSSHNSAMDYLLMAEDVRDLMDAHKFSDAFVLGHSMGGKTAMQLALLHPAAVRRLVVVDIAPRVYAPRHEKIINSMLSLDLRQFQSRKEMEAALAPAIPEVATRQFLLKNVAHDSSGGFRWKIGLAEIKQNYPRLTEAVTGEKPFRNPTLFLRGEKSDVLLESDFASIQHLFPRARLQTIAGAGHLVHAENPDGFMQAVLEFLSMKPEPAW